MGKRNSYCVLTKDFNSYNPLISLGAGTTNLLIRSEETEAQREYVTCLRLQNWKLLEPGFDTV